MRRILICSIILSIICCCFPAHASEIKVTVSGQFLIIAQETGINNNILSVRKSHINTVHLEGRIITIVTSAEEVVEEYINGNIRKIERLKSYSFNDFSESKAKAKFDYIMKVLSE